MDVDSDRSETASIMSLSDSIRGSLYRYKGDRRYQSVNDHYSWPCDASAATHEMLLHKLFERIFDNGLYWDPQPGMLSEVLRPRRAQSLDGPPRMLDLGSGVTASWSIAMADRFPTVECIGVDLIPSDHVYVPPNLVFEVADLLEGLPYPDEFFSLVHCRFPGSGGQPGFFESPTSLTTHFFFSEIVRVLRPGGILLLEDVDNLQTPFCSDAPNNPFLAMANAGQVPCWEDVIRCRPQDEGRPSWGARMGGLVRETEGLGRVEERTFKMPFGMKADGGPPQEQAGCLHREAWLVSWELEAARREWDEETIQRQRRKDEQALPERDVGMHVNWRVVWAVKEVVAEDETTPGRSDWR